MGLGLTRQAWNGLALVAKPCGLPSSPLGMTAAQKSSRSYQNWFTERSLT